MLQRFKRWIYSLRPLLMVTIGKCFLKLLLFTCRMKVKGIEKFCETVKTKPTILMLWHNRLVIAPEILFRFAPQFLYAAVVSKSRDGEMLSRIVHSYKNGRTITVPHNDRYGALQNLITCLKEGKQVAVITPDGPRGPRYKLKPGVAIAALEAEATVFSLNWESSNYWKLKSWDQLRIPKPFSTITVEFGEPIHLAKDSISSLEEAKKILREALPDGD